MTGSVGSLSPERLFGIAVRAARQARDWSQEALAANLASAGISVGGQSGVARIERGERPTRLNEAIGIASFLDIDLGVFSQPVPITDAERLNANLGNIQARIRTLGAEIQTVSGERDRTRKIINDLEKRLAKLTTVRDALIAQRDDIVHDLRKVGDERIRRDLDMLERIDSWREKERRYGDR